MPLAFCKRCLYASSHPLGLTLDEEGICSGCRIHEEKDRLDWAARWAKLQQLVKPYRADGRNYDCIVPVSGAADSFYIVHLVKERLGLVAAPVIVAQTGTSLLLTEFGPKSRAMRPGEGR